MEPKRHSLLKDFELLKSPFVVIKENYGDAGKFFSLLAAVFYGPSL